MLANTEWEVMQWYNSSMLQGERFLSLIYTFISSSHSSDMMARKHEDVVLKVLLYPDAEMI